MDLSDAIEAIRPAVVQISGTAIGSPDQIGAVGVPRLAGVQPLGLVERGSRDREPLDEGGHATSIVHARSVKPLLSAGMARRDSSAGPRSPARRRRRPARS
jgi:hypothetical protein